MAAGTCPACDPGVVRGRGEAPPEPWEDHAALSFGPSRATARAEEPRPTADRVASASRNEKREAVPLQERDVELR